MGLNYRRRMRLGPLPIWRTVVRSRHGKTAFWTVKILGVSWNSRTKRKTVGLPGGFSYTSK